MIPLSVPNFEGNELKYVTDAVAQGWVSTGGAYINEFEQKFAEFVKTPAAVACQSGTAALHLALIESGVEAGELVIVPTLTFIAAVNPVRYQGADPVFMDCDDSLCMDPEKLRRFCTEECEFDETSRILRHRESGKRIRTLIVVHVFGNMADMESIMEIAAAYGLSVIEDATEALGTRYTEGRYAGKFAGTIGDFGAYSFNGNKIITTGGGGMLVAANPDQLAHMKYLSTQAKDDTLFYVHDEVGYNYRMTNVQAAIGVAQLECLSEFIRRKNVNYDLYKKLFEGWDKGSLLPFREGTFSNRWFYSVCFKEGDYESLRRIISRLSDAGVQTRAIWNLIHLQKPYKNCIAYEIEKADFYMSRVLNIPCSTDLKAEDIRKVAKTLLEQMK